MSAEKVVKIDNNYEVEVLKARINLLESVLDYSIAETVQGLKSKVKLLENEAITLRATDTEKDKLIAEKEQRIAEIKKNFDTQLQFKLAEQRRIFEAEKNQSLKDQRKNIRSKEVKPEKQKVELANEERDRIKEMYDSLLKEHTKSHENEAAILSLCESKFAVIIDLINKGATKEEMVTCMAEAKETLAQARIRKECTQIHDYLIKGYSPSEIARLMYPNTERRAQKVSERINSAVYNEMFKA